MAKYFNVAGPCAPDKHYMLPARERCREIDALIEQSQYFVIHAARQTGKTTLLQELAQQINAEGRRHAVYCSLEALQTISDPREGIPEIVKKLQAYLHRHPVLRQHPFAENADYDNFTNVFQETLTTLCEASDKPVVILFDEVDCLSNGTLIAFLRQLREGYVMRSQIPFVDAVALVGMRNICDYKAQIRDDQQTLGSASPFNIVTESLTLRNFTRDEVARLYAQHADATGQAFPPEVADAAFAATQGQPWLVNAIARDIVVKLLDNNPTRPILPEMVETAAQRLILRRDTHIDSLMERLREPRVRRIVEPVIAGEIVRYDLLDDDYRYALDLGLLCQEARRLIPANPIYGEVIVRTLNFRTQQEIEDLTPEAALPAYIQDGRLDMTRLLREFQQFWREHSAIRIERFDYKEAAPHLVLQAFLQRVINGGGRIMREMAAGTRRLDLCVEYQRARYPIELKVRYGEQTYAEGQRQLLDYLNTLGCAEGWLLVFDRRPDIAWEAKLFWREVVLDGKTLHLVGC